MDAGFRNKLYRLVGEYLTAHPDVRVVAVSGSIGKTSTRIALATVLAEQFRVRMNEGDQDDEIAVLLAVLGVRQPAKLNWRNRRLVISAARQRIKAPSDCDVVIVELNAIRPGYVADLARALKPRYGVMTGVAHKRLDVFGTIESVAAEELSLVAHSELALVNRDETEERFADLLQTANFTTYGTQAPAEYRIEIESISVQGGASVGKLYIPEYPDTPFEVSLSVLGELGVRPIAAAVAVAVRMGMNFDQIRQVIPKIKPKPGRMNVLSGIDGTYVIDDSYASSPSAAISALQALYMVDSQGVPQKIAVLGDMLGLDSQSQTEHAKVGQFCDPNYLSWLVLVGKESEQYLAPAARARGCQVYVAADAIDAGRYVRSIAESGAVILVKGSADGIYLEEAVKILCNTSQDTAIVRQEPELMARKDQLFNRF